MVLYIIVGILLFGLLIAVHEGGHFLAAKRLDVQVNEFSIGMGPAIFSRQKGETLYSLRAFPIGGYCAMEGEDEDSKNPRAFSRKAAWRKLIILAAGSVMNFVAGFVLVAILFGVAGSYTVPVIRDFAEGFAYAGEDGLQRGDRFLSINGHKVTVYSDVSTQFSAAQGGTMDLVVERNGEAVTLEDFPLQPQEYVVDGQTVTMYGIYFATEEVTPLGLLKQSWDTCWYFARAVGSGLVMLVTGQVGLDDMSGSRGHRHLPGGGREPRGQHRGGPAERVLRHCPHRGESGHYEFAPPACPGRGPNFPAGGGRGVVPLFGTKTQPQVRGVDPRRGIFPAYSVDGAGHLQRHLEVGGLT